VSGARLILTGLLALPLNRTLNLPILTLFGLGTVVGAGIYVLLGEVVASAGTLAPLSFILAFLLAGFSAFSFAELSARMPRSAGEALYVLEGFRSRSFSTFVGLMVVTVGGVSTATLSNGFVGYAGELTPLPGRVLIVIFVGSLRRTGRLGDQQSQVGGRGADSGGSRGLVIVIVFAGVSPDPGASAAAPAYICLGRGTMVGVLGGTVLAFFAFIGFDEMVNVVEEVKDVKGPWPF